ncbi:hypothetical protein ACFE04_024009 [Oxalis oulophora]
MATICPSSSSFVSSSPSSNRSSVVSFPISRISIANPRKSSSLSSLVLASSSSSTSSSSFDHSPPKKSVLFNLIQEIEPLDISLIQKDVPPTTLDAMKRTISGMLGLLPSDRFQVFIEAVWEPLSKLLISSMMTGYTLRNAECRLCLERNLGIHEEDLENQTSKSSKFGFQGIESARKNAFFDENELSKTEESSVNWGLEGLGKMSPEAQQYILSLQSQLSSAKRDLHEAQRKTAALQMQQFVGEEKNDLLDYLRSLQPEKVAELSEPTSPELKEAIHCVVHGLLATLSPKMHSKVPENNTRTKHLNTQKIEEEDCTELIENASLQFQPIISLTRDYLARLLFWCMLLGHHMRGLEYRMELTDLLSLTHDFDFERDTKGDEQAGVSNKYR